MPSNTTTFRTNDAIDRLVTYEIQLDLATEANVPIERRLATAIAGSILLSNARSIPADLYLPIEKTFLHIIETRITHLLAEVGDSLDHRGETPSPYYPAEEATRPYPEEDSRPFPPDPSDEEEEDRDENRGPGWSEYDNLPYEEGGEDDWNRDSNWGCW
tara:strand:- start:48 stop:524 length:477 start_codon:yes stop_codon:yes gene_type:complete